MREYLLVLLITAAVTFVLTPLVRRVAVATRAIHAPRARDSHTTPTPLLGGLAMYGGLVAGLIVASRPRPPPMRRSSSWARPSRSISTGDRAPTPSRRPSST